jgi:hypothetical protein
MSEPVSVLAELARGGDLGHLISMLRARVTADRRVFADPDVKAWCARRWRFLFLNEAVKDPVALAQASRRFWDRRPARRRIAEYFLVGAAQAAWQDEQPEASAPAIRNTTLIACPGLLNGLLPALREFREQLPAIARRFSLRVLRADSHPVRGCAANVADILAAVNAGRGLDAGGGEVPASAATPPGDILLVGYSKGAPDILTALMRHPEIVPRVRAVVTIAGAVAGSEVADDVLGRFERSDLRDGARMTSHYLQGLLPPGLKLGLYAGRRLPEFDVESAARDLTTAVRGAFLAEHRAALDALKVPMFFLAGATRLAEVPRLQRGCFRLLTKFDESNDMQVTAKRAALPLPMATDLGLVRGHHWDLAYPSFIKGRWLGHNNTFHPFPKNAMLAAIVLLAAELGLID